MEYHRRGGKAIVVAVLLVLAGSPVWELTHGLEAEVNRRVAAVARGEAYMRTRGRPIAMPRGDIFAATGEWEAYATPVRDWRLLIAFDVVERASVFAMAYNPNDCVERRWGEPASELCTRSAPELQRQRMEELRVWFRERKRPPF